MRSQGKEEHTALGAGAAVRGEGVEIAGSEAGGAVGGGLVAVAEATSLGLARASGGGVSAGDGRAELGGGSHGGGVGIGGGGVVVHEILVLGVEIQSIDLGVGSHSALLCSSLLLSSPLLFLSSL
jgi:hypothetical protein